MLFSYWKYGLLKGIVRYCFKAFESCCWGGWFLGNIPGSRFPSEEIVALGPHVSLFFSQAA